MALVMRLEMALPRTAAPVLMAVAVTEEEEELLLDPDPLLR